MNQSGLKDELYLELGLGTRMRRLIETLTNGMEKMYAEQNITFRTGHFYAFYAIVERGPLTINEIASLAGFSHSAVSQTVKKLASLRLIETRAMEDGRQKSVHLTDHGIQMVEKLKPSWDAIEAVVKDAIEESDVDFLAAIAGLENAFRRKSVYDRLQEKLTGPNARPAFQIVPYDTRWRQAFLDLNIWWLKKYFRVEPIDEVTLRDPEGKILDKGGEIYFATVDGTAVGTVAMKFIAPGIFELTKLGVDPNVQKGGMGRALCEQVMNRFLARGGKTLFLETNTVLTPAIALYKKLGFVEKPNPNPDSPYERSNYYMEWEAHP